MFEVIALRKQPALAAPFVRHFEQAWPGWYGPGGEGNAQRDIEAFANRAGDLPVGVVAIDVSGQPVGIAALKATSIASHTHLTPWATAGYVMPAHRGKGIGAALLRALVAEARRLGFTRLYCATAGAASLLQREGWREIDAVLHDDDLQRVFECAVS